MNSTPCRFFLPTARRPRRSRGAAPVRRCRGSLGRVRGSLTDDGSARGHGPDVFDGISGCPGCCFSWQSQTQTSIAVNTAWFNYVLSDEEDSSHYQAWKRPLAWGISVYEGVRVRQSAHERPVHVTAVLAYDPILACSLKQTHDRCLATGMPRGDGVRHPGGPIDDTYLFGASEGAQWPLRLESGAFPALA